MACTQAVRSTHSPIGTISPVSSASGMNSVGEMMPRSGWRQRTSASTPTISPELHVDLRLVQQVQLVVLASPCASPLPA
jgi:hypothetical protein